MKHIATISLITASLVTSCAYGMDKQIGKEVVVHHRLHDVFTGKNIHFIHIPEQLRHLFQHAESTTAQGASAQSEQPDASEKKELGFHPILSVETKVEDKLIQEAKTVVIDFAWKELGEAKTVVSAKLEETENKLYNMLVYKAAPLTVAFVLGCIVTKHLHTTNN